MSVIHAPRKPELELRYLIFLIVIGSGLLVLFLRLWYLQVVASARLIERADNFRTSPVTKLAPRGLIEDRNGRLLASVKPEVVVTAIPKVVAKNPWVIDKLASMLQVPAQKLRDKVADANWRPFLASPIHVGASVAVATRIAESSNELPGIGVETQPMRQYANTKEFAHILGYVWTPSENDVKRFEGEDRKPAEYVGKVGIEYVYERDLMGTPGAEDVELDAKGRPIRIVGRENPVPGSKLVLSIDADLQVAASRMLEEIYHDRRAPGAVVALDPRNGEVLCLASSPSYDTGIFKGGISRADWEALSNHPDHPLTNRAIFGTYAPGSTFKIVTSLAAEHQKMFSTSRTAYCPGYFQLGNRKFKCLGRHGSVAFRGALTDSCNTYFADLGVRVGREAIVAASLESGLGRRSGLDLLGEGKGTIPTDEWIRAVQRKKPGEEIQWYLGNTVNMSIGQGDVTATPLQMANVASMVANDGTIFKPHLVKAKVPSTPEAKAVPIAPEILAHAEASPEFWATVRSAMVNVMENGTAKVGTAIPGVRWAGKTGSSEFKKGDKTHSWFIGFAPAENPQIAIAVVVEAAGHGSEVAAPLAAKLVRQWLKADQGMADPNAASASRQRRTPSALARL